MRRLHISLIFVFISNFLFGQAPRIDWQRCLGGSADETIGENSAAYSASNNALIGISSDRYLVGSQSSSADGDLTGNKGNTDIWLMCLDQYGNTLWQKGFGGSGKESIGGIQETSDNGFIVLGTSTSNDGDVSGNHGKMDFWLFRLDLAGNILWQKSFGGSDDDIAAEIKLTPDQGFIVVGMTRSLDGDVVGKHPGVDNNVQTTDGWIIKLDSNGSIQWQKCIGNSSYEYLESILITSDGNYLTAGIANNDSTCGNSFNLLVKLDSNGSFLWQNCNSSGANAYYTLEDITETIDGGYAIVGSRFSVFSQGYKTSAYLTKFDSQGKFLWEKLIGDSSSHYFFTDVVQQADGIFFICGVKSKYERDFPGDIWISSLSSDGNLLWEKIYGSSSFDSNPSIVKSPAGGYLMAAVTSGNDGDVKGKHNPTTINSDIWIVKLGASNTIKGIIYYDKNFNETRDPDEPLISDAVVKSEKAGNEISAISSSGLFINTVDTGTYLTTVINNPHYKSVPLSRTSVFNNYNNIDSISFAIQSIPGQRDLTISIIPLNVARTGLSMSCLIFYKNVGTDTIKNGEILFKKDQRYSFISAMPANSSIGGDTIKWNYSDLRPMDSASISIVLRLQVPPVVNLNDTLSSLAIITPVTGDLTPLDDTAYLNQIVVGSYDPNDKSENLAGKISLREVSSSSYINYLIRFQNTGTDTAFNVAIRDTLDDKLDWSSLQMIAASHPYQLNIKSQNQLTWSFNNILLVDSNRNEPASHGFVAYRVKPKNNLVIGDIIRNRASIYFDFNLPVETNMQETEVVMYSISNPQVSTPTITSFTPTSAASGATVTITGTNFTGTTAVSFGGTAATSFTVNSATSITATVGAGASGNVSVTTPGGTATLAGFTFIPAPAITSSTPTSGGAGASITITGTNFTGATAVSFGGTAATSFTVNSATSITATVGAGASGNVSITTPGGTATLAGFTFIPAPTITSFTPTSGGTGASITITGTDFTGSTAVSFGGTAATSFTVNSATSITAVVGTGATGNVSVTTPGGTVTLAGFTYTVVTAIDPVPGNSLGIRLYPNPTSGSFVIDTLKLSDKWEILEIFDTDGKKKLSSFNIKNKTMVTINIDHLSNGFYTAILRRKNRQPAVIKFLKL